MNPFMNVLAISSVGKFFCTRSPQIDPVTRKTMFPLGFLNGLICSVIFVELTMAQDFTEPA